jgi:hypothetical protein
MSEVWGYIVGVFLIAGLVIAFFWDFEQNRDVTQMTSEERLAALGRAVKLARSMNGSSK